MAFLIGYENDYNAGANAVPRGIAVGSTVRVVEGPLRSIYEKGTVEWVKGGARLSPHLIPRHRPQRGNGFVEYRTCMSSFPSCRWRAHPKPPAAIDPTPNVDPPVVAMSSSSNPIT